MLVGMPMARKKRSNASIPAKAVSYSHGIDSKLCETGGIFKVDVTRPTAPYGGQARTVGYIEHAAEFVFQKVRGPV